MPCIVAEILPELSFLIIWGFFPAIGLNPASASKSSNSNSGIEVIVVSESFFFPVSANWPVKFSFEYLFVKLAVLTVTSDIFPVSPVDETNSYNPPGTEIDLNLSSISYSAPQGRFLMMTVSPPLIITSALLSSPNVTLPLTPAVDVPADVIVS